MVKFSRFLGGKSAKMHTNGMADLASNSSIGGSASPESFAKRQAVDRNRRHVGGFSKSGVVQAYRGAALGTLHNTRTSQSQARNQRFGMAQKNIDGVRQPGASSSFTRAQPSPTKFTEPPRRGFNPYK